MPNTGAQMEAALKLFLESMKHYPNDELTHAGAYRAGWHDCMSIIVDKTTQPAAGGEWVKMSKWVHRCAKPDYKAVRAVGALSGDVWKCSECAQCYQLRINSDMRGDDWVDWKEVKHPAPLPPKDPMSERM